MAYNIPDSYSEQAPAEQLDKKTLNNMVWRSLFLQASFNYERMQAGGWLFSILPGLKKIHKNEKDLAASMSHNLEFFNTHPFLVNFVMGIILSMEQNKADIPMIRAVRVAAMGPLGGIGDALFWFTLVPITAGITANMAINGNIAAPVYFLTGIQCGPIRLTVLLDALVLSFRDRCDWDLNGKCQRVHPSSEYFRDFCCWLLDLRVWSDVFGYSDP